MEQTIGGSPWCRNYPRETAGTFRLVKGTGAFFEFHIASNAPFATASASIKANIDFFVESFHLNQLFSSEWIIYDIY